MKTQTPHQFDFKGLSDWVHIFSVGEHIPGNFGKPMTFTHADLSQMVETHDPKHPAKHVVTHKELFSPFGYGNAAEYKVEGDHLFVRSEKIEPQFEALVKNDRLPERSIRLTKTKDGKWKVGHIAWLGAEPPAVDGLEPVEFQGAKEGVFDFAVTTVEQEAGWSFRSLGRLLRGLRDWIISEKGIEEADNVLPDYAIEDVVRAGDNLLDKSTPLFSADDDSVDISTDIKPTDNPDEGDKPVTISQEDHDAAVKAERDKASAAVARAQELEDKAHRAEFSAFVDALKCDPAKKEGAIDFLMSIRSEQTFEFSAGDGTKKSVDPVEFAKSLLSSIQSSVSEGEHDFSGGPDEGSELKKTASAIGAGMRK